MKRLFSAILILSLLLGLCPMVALTPAQATSTEDPALCPHCGLEAEWTALTSADSGETKALTEGHYNLNDDIIDLKAAFYVDAEVVIDLRGHTITSTDRAFYVNAGGKLSIMDSVGGGVVNGGSTKNGGVIYMTASTTFTLYGGEIVATDTTTAKNGGAIYCETGATLTVKDGTIRGNKANRGGTIYLNTATLEMTGGTVVGSNSNFKADHAGAIYAANGSTLTISQDPAKGTVATVMGGHSTDQGGNIYSLASTLNLDGGIIRDGVAGTKGGNIVNDGKSVYNITAGSLIGGKANDSGDNLYVGGSSAILNISGGFISGGLDIRSNSNINISGNPVITGERGGLVINNSAGGKTMTLGELTKGADITVCAKGTFTTANTKAQEYLDKGYIKSGNAAEITVVDNKLTVNTEADYCPHCKQVVTWAEWTAKTSADVTAGGHYYLAANKNISGRYGVNIADLNEEVVLDLRGFKIVSNNNRAFYITAGKLVIVDSVGYGVLQGHRNTGGTLALAPDAQVDMYGGTVKTTYENPTKGSIVQLASGAVMNLYGGALDGSGVTTPTDMSSTVYVVGDMNVYGGTIAGGYSVDGGNVYVLAGGSLNMSGGTIVGGEAIGDAQTGGKGEYATGGGNVFIANGGKFTLSNGVIRNGTAAGYGGNVFAAKGGEFEMSGGEISGGLGDKDQNDKYNGDNVFVYGAMTMTGGTIVAENDTDRQNGSSDHMGNGILTWNNASLTLGGTADVLNADKVGNIYLGSKTTFHVQSGFTGNASVSANAYYHLSTPVLGGFMKELDTSDGPFTGELYLEGDYGLPRIYGVDGKLIVGGTASLTDAEGNVTWYEYAQDAANAYGEAAYLKVYMNNTINLADGSYALDLNGKNVTLSGAGSVTGFDSANDDYKTYGFLNIADGAAVTVANTFAQEVGDQTYYMIQNEDGYSFHLMGQRVSGVSIRPSIAGIYYKGTWQMDDLLKEKVTQYGVAVSTVAQPDQNFMGANSTALWTAYEGTELVSGEAVTSVLISNILVKDNEKNGERGKTGIWAATYVILNDGEGDVLVVSEKEVKYSLYDVMLKLDEEANYEKNKDALDAFYGNWVDPMSGWGFVNIGKAATE